VGIAPRADRRRAALRVYKPVKASTLQRGVAAAAGLGGVGAQ